ncbi:Tau-tubulin kinase 1 [Trichinella spiralis]|uniref:Tau-tubulin kinase 1 n=1 Tax=Trichinella spiralis TaxID=6334 RepID=E5SFD0_TRISP|nr:Tau-tubulin kinase 1 [Trichinella spiralis]KRY40801.1 Tau-tubulin kinase 1 [Trichinella spiralis]
MAGKEHTLPKGYVIRGIFEVVQTLGAGAFGAVYMVEDKRKGKKLAMKVEPAGLQTPFMKLETYVLQRMQGMPHSLAFQAAGIQEENRYLIMQLAGENLSDLRKACPEGRITLSTTLRIVRQCTEALRDLHSIGFIHRDVKPGNFALGRDPENSRTVYLLDYGMAREIINPKTGTLRKKRKRCGFRGTPKYASPNVHLNKEQGRHDDLYSTFYMLIEFYYGNLPWSRSGNFKQLAELKLAVKQRTLIGNLPKEIYAVHNELCKLKYEDVPDYDWFIQQYDKVMEMKGYSMEAPYDWEEGGEDYKHTVQQPQRQIINPYQSQIEEQNDVVEENDPEN